jgi:DNA-binding NarL/FixJ family response regulator
VIHLKLTQPTATSLTAAARVLVLTAYHTDSQALPTIEAGATGYLLNDALQAGLLLVGLQAVARKGGNPQVQTRRTSRLGEPTRLPGGGFDGVRPPTASTRPVP